MGHNETRASIAAFWTPEKLAISKQMDARGCSATSIAAAVSAPRVSLVEYKLYTLGSPEARANPGSRRIVPADPSVIAARAVRCDLAARREARDLARGNVTALVFGDPLPGRSALDQMRARQ